VRRLPPCNYFNMRISANLYLILLTFTLSQDAWAAGKAAHVVVVVWDGMRPDFVSAETTPNLFKLLQHGVTFLHHHPVCVSSTEVNGTAIATGAYPEVSDIVGNREYRPAIDPEKVIRTESLESARAGDKLTGNHYIAVPTIAEILHEHGLRTAVAGTKPIALLHDRGERNKDALGVTVFSGQVMPQEMSKELAVLGTFNMVDKNRIKADQWTARALTGPLWKNGVPPFSLLWMGEPDASQHAHTPGSPEALAGIKGSDADLGLVLETLEKKGVRDQTDVIMVSDHGFSSVLAGANIANVLNTNGFHAVRDFSNAKPVDGDILVMGNGSGDFLYVTGYNPKLIAKVVHCLEGQPFTGMVFTKEPVEGAFTLEDIKLNSPDAPDIVLSMRWNNDQNKFGAPGMIYADSPGYGPGQGTHVTLGPSDMHNTCIAAGPDFQSNIVDTLATGNVDIAPTVLWILGIEPAKKMSGRVLSEALSIPGPPVQSVQPAHRETTWQGKDFVWHQYLDSIQVNDVIYFDEGNGYQKP